MFGKRSREERRIRRPKKAKMARKRVRAGRKEVKAGRKAVRKEAKAVRKEAQVVRKGVKERVRRVASSSFCWLLFLTKSDVVMMYGGVIHFIESVPGLSEWFKETISGRIQMGNKRLNVQ